MSNIGPADTVKGFFLLVDKERYPELNELKRDVVELDINAMNTDPYYLYAFNLAKVGIVAGQTTDPPCRLTFQKKKGKQRAITQKFLV